MTVSESQLQEQVARYITAKYPDVMFHSDFGSGVKLTPGQAKRQKRQNGGRRAWPDLFIAEPMAHPIDDVIEFCDKFALSYPTSSAPGVVVASGLFLELKREGTRLTKKNGDWATPHIQEQAAVLSMLRSRGYVAEFAVGIEDAKRKIDEYLGSDDEIF